MSFGRAFACSLDREGHGLNRGPVFSATVDLETGEVTTTGLPLT